MRRGHVWLIVGVITVFMVGHAQAQTRGYAVYISHRVVNQGGMDAENLVAHCLVPAASRYQEVAASAVLPEPDTTHTDREGQQTVSVSLGTLEPGQSRAVRALVWARPRPVGGPLVAAAEGVEPLTPEARAGHLQDGWLLQLDGIRPLAERLTDGLRRDVDKARALYDHMVEHCVYDLDEREKPADRVLAGEPSSCTELAYTFVALCRAVDLPARVVSAYVRRDRGSTSIDWATHRWAEFFAEGIGWVPVDPTNKLNYPSENFFGRQRPNYIAILDDGVLMDEAPNPGWRVFWAHAEPEGVILSGGRSAVWIQSRDQRRERAAFEEGVAVLNDPDRAKRLEAVESWGPARNPLRLGLWLDAIFDEDPSVRRAAARGLGGFGDPTAAAPLLRAAEMELDRQTAQAFIDAVAELLHAGPTERRARTVVEISRSRTESGLALLDEIWRDPELDVRESAAQALYRFGDRPGVHEIYRALVNDESDHVRIVAALRWSRVGSRRALEVLVGHLESPVRWDRRRALEELVIRTGDSFGFDPDARGRSVENEQAIQAFYDWLDRNPDAR